VPRVVVVMVTKHHCADLLSHHYGKLLLVLS